MKMEIVRGLPPNFDKIVSVIPAACGRMVMFCYGTKIFNPGGEPIASWLIAHEEVHCLQQGDDVEGWWDRYLSDVQFRFRQELVAHRQEWRSWLSAGVRNRAQRRAMMAHIASRLSGPLYGRIVGFSSAREMILAENPI